MYILQCPILTILQTWTVHDHTHTSLLLLLLYRDKDSKTQLFILLWGQVNITYFALK